MEQGKEYYAFISYKREDEKWAKWLQHKLEHYHFPINFNGRSDLPKYIRPTFRDVTDLTPGLLAEEIDKALRSSEWLVIICSPRSAKSPWVCKEAQTFIDLLFSDILRDLAKLQPEFKIIMDRHVRPEVIALENHGGRAFFRGQRNDGLAVDGDITVGQVDETAYGTQDRSLSAAGRTE